MKVSVFALGSLGKLIDRKEKEVTNCLQMLSFGANTENTLVPKVLVQCI